MSAVREIYKRRILDGIPVGRNLITSEVAFTCCSTDTLRIFTKDICSACLHHSEVPRPKYLYICSASLGIILHYSEFPNLMPLSDTASYTNRAEILILGLRLQFQNYAVRSISFRIYFLNNKPRAIYRPTH